ncbi:MAG: hypothetical protein GX755_00350 [Syntrophomonadaceae bacterium]|nr:hypothetical protein [Syntrophomonadaceae bacterium]
MADASVIFGYLFIFVARVTDMSLDVLRILMLTRGNRLNAALIGFLRWSFFCWPWGRCCGAD